jgi:MoxR-like ATPase
LAETIQGLGEEADVIWVLGVNESSGLTTVDALGEVAVQERILDIKLVDGPLTRCCQV